MERISAAVVIKASGAAMGVECHIVSEMREVEYDRAWVIEEPYDVASRTLGACLKCPSYQQTSKDWYEIKVLMSRGADIK